ncbi:hypothetical protein BCAR13_1120020 [Paraburkholderia caribensis]|nr:hypothetical protein BCAR13_1120020 [Paraburkholderia caribensis]
MLAAARRRACIQGSGKPAPYCITHGGTARRERVLAVGWLWADCGLTVGWLQAGRGASLACRWRTAGVCRSYAPHLP